MRASEKAVSRARELRREMSLPEVVLWQALRKGGLAGLRFRRQHPIGPYILDFYCASARLAVEVDGLAHDAAAQLRHDQRRQAWLAQRGVSVLRVGANDVLRDENLEGVLLAIEHAASPPPARFAPPPPQGGGGARVMAPPLRSGGGGPCGAWWRGCCEHPTERDDAIAEPQTAQEIIGYYARRIAQDVKLPSEFATLAP